MKRRIKHVFSVGLLATTVAACGPTSVADEPDAAVRLDSSSVAIDAAPPARCSITSPFGSPTPVPGINTSDDELSFRLSADGLTAIIGRKVTDGPRLFIATRPNLRAPFGTPALLVGPVNSADASRGQLFPGTLSLYFETSRDGDPDIVLSTRGKATADFGNPADVSPIETSGVESQPYFVPNGNLYFVRGGQGVMFWPAGGNATASPLMGFSAMQSPALSYDELEIFVADGAVLKHATRSSSTAMFGSLTALTPLNGMTVTEPTFVSSNACELYFSADRTGGVGGRDIWVASRL